MVVRTLTHPRLFAGIIPDGFHVDPLNLALAARMMPDRLFLVTDAIRTFAGAVPNFDLMGTPVTLREGRLTGPGGTLAGAHLGMYQVVRVIVESAGVAIETAVAMASATPAKLMRIEGELGRVAPKYCARLTFLDVELRTRGGFVDGCAFA